MTSGTSPAGLQAERTRLAWQRTALGLLANGVLHLLGRRNPPPLTPVVVVVSVLLALAALAIGHRRSRAMLHRPAEPPPPLHRDVLVLGAGVVLLGLLTGVTMVGAWTS